MHRSTLTVTGSGFGTKATAEPFVWDDFESGVVGNPLSSSQRWIHYENGSRVFPQYSNLQAYSGARAAYNFIDRPADGEDFSTAGLRGLQATEMYFSYQFRWEVVSGTMGAGFIKTLRGNGVSGFYHARPRFYTSVHPGATLVNAGYAYTGADADGAGEAASNVPANTWNRMEGYYKLSAPAGSANGMLQTWANLLPRVNLVNVMTLPSAQAGQLVDNFLLPFMASNLSTVQLRLFVDDIYVDRTRARVEIGDADTWTACRQREVQIPTSWSNTAITLNVNQGRFANGARGYVYVVNADGRVNARGVPLSFAP